MSDNNDTAAQTENAQEQAFTGRKPDYNVYAVKDLPDDKSRWTRIGSAWSHKDGEGVKIRVDCTPLNGEIDLRKIRDEQMPQYESGQRCRYQHRFPRNPPCGFPATGSSTNALQQGHFF